MQEEILVVPSLPLPPLAPEMPDARSAIPPRDDALDDASDTEQYEVLVPAAESSEPSEWPLQPEFQFSTPDMLDAPVVVPPPKTRLQRFLMLLGGGTIRCGHGAFHLSKLGYRHMQPMRRRDWATVVGLLIAVIALGAYMSFDKLSHSISSASLPNCRWHVVVAGDTLATIARANKISVSQIAHANNMFDVNDPTVGQRLCLPVQAEAAKAVHGIPLASQTDGPVIQGEPAFVRFVLPYARRAHDATGWPISLILAQWGLEQAWQAPNFTGYNFGNCGGLLNEPFIPGTAAVGSPSSFAYADSPEDGLRFYVHVAHLSYYDQVAVAAKQGGPIAAARALGESPWDASHYTDHNDPGSSLIALMQQYNLHQYDAR